jgi:hypothetical protein
MQDFQELADEAFADLLQKPWSADRPEDGAPESAPMPKLLGLYALPPARGNVIPR